MMGDEKPKKDRLDALEKQVASMKSDFSRMRYEFSEVVGLLKQLLMKEKPLEKPKDAPSKTEDGSEESKSDGESDSASKISQQEGKSSFRNLKIDFKIEVPMYDCSINVDKLFEPPLLDDDGDNKTVLPSIEDLWFDREDPLAGDCILERKVTTTRKGEQITFRIGGAGQVPSKAKWFSKEKGTLEFTNLQFQLKREFKFLKGGAMIRVYPSLLGISRFILQVN
ncbi:hypothetical protein ACLB2K_062719 [Fragaria x ananassa]